MKVKHTLEPIYDSESQVLILGSIPSLKSRELNFYYAHPYNRFWTTMEKVFSVEIGNNIEDKKKFLHIHHIALFDVIKECDIEESSDSTIKNAIPNDLNLIINNSKISTIFTTGRKAFDLYNKLCFKDTNIKAIYLPSTSPANCRKGIEKLLVEQYGKVKNCIK